MSRIRKQTRIRVTARWIAGRELDGYPRTDATWLRRGTRPTHGEQPWRWHYLPGWQRAAWRNGLPLACAAEVAGLVVHPLVTEVADTATGAAVVAYGAYRVRRAFRHWQHRRTYVAPFYRQLSTVLGLADSDSPDRWVTVPVDFAEDDAEPVRITLPPALRIAPEVKVAIREVVSHKLGLYEVAETWHTIGQAPYVTFRPAPRPPAKVAFADVREAMEAATETQPVLGIGCRGRIVTADLEADSPHIAISAGSGGGKSYLARVLLAHALHHGGQVVVLDYKRASQRWAEGLPGVTIAKNIEDIHEVACQLGAECERRNRAADDGGHIGPRVILLVEEWNALAGKLQTYWDAMRTKDDPKRSPAVASISDITFMGRHVLMNVIGVAQMLTARTTGGPETRENFATRCLTRYTVNAWKMLAPEVWPMPKKSKTVGRWQIVKGGDAYETQVTYMTDDEARTWALSGVACAEPVLASHAVPTQRGQAETVPAVTLVGLRAAVDSGQLGEVTIDQVRKWRTRHENFPTPAGKNGAEELYDLDQLAEFARMRRAISVVKDEAA